MRHVNAVAQLYLLHAAVIAVLALLTQLRQVYLRAPMDAAELDVQPAEADREPGASWRH